jgi:hypothetical protein
MPRPPNAPPVQDPLLAEGVVYCEGLAKGEDFFSNCNAQNVLSTYTFLSKRNVWIAKGCTLVFQRLPGRSNRIQRCAACSSLAGNLKRWCERDQQRDQKIKSKNIISSLVDSQNRDRDAAATAVIEGLPSGVIFWKNYYRNQKENGLEAKKVLISLWWV